MISRVNVCLDRNEALDVLEESIKKSFGTMANPAPVIDFERRWLTIKLIIWTISAVCCVAFGGLGLIAFFIMQTFEIYRKYKYIEQLILQLKEYYTWNFNKQSVLGGLEMMHCSDEKEFDMWYFLETSPNNIEVIANKMKPPCKLLFLLANSNINKLFVSGDKLQVETANTGTFTVDAIVKDDNPNAVSITRSGVFLSKLESTPTTTKWCFNYIEEKGSYVKEGLND